MEIKLSKPFASNGNVDEFDVRQIKRALNKLGYYTPPKDMGLTDIPDRGVFEALKAFQKGKNLRADGTARPDDETIQEMNLEMEEQNGKGQYRWITMGDARVRPEHAALEGAVRTWGDFPEPGEEENCRCIAEPISTREQERERNQTCIDIWESIKDIRDEISSVIEKILDQENKRRNIEKIIGEIREKIQDIVGDQIPNISNIGLSDLIKIIEKYIGIAILVIDMGQILALLKELKDAEKELEKYNENIKNLQKNLEDLKKQEKDKIEQIDTLCPDFFT